MLAKRPRDLEPKSEIEESMSKKAKVESDVEVKQASTDAKVGPAPVISSEEKHTTTEVKIEPSNIPTEPSFNASTLVPVNAFTSIAEVDVELQRIIDYQERLKWRKAQLRMQNFSIHLSANALDAFLDRCEAEV